MDAINKLKNKTSKGLHVCVGLDTDLEKIPNFLGDDLNAFIEFNKNIIDATKEYAAAYKLNLAFYERLGEKFYDAVYNTVKYIPEDILIIGDAKRGDIGNTSKMYADAIFNEMNFDSITLHPYMGYDSVSPFLEYKDKLSFILALTSNKGSLDFEKLILEDGNYLYQHVIKKITEWDVNNNTGFVFGATNLEELEINLEILGDKPLLLPGVGAQGGDAQGISMLFKKNSIQNFLINVSRGLIYFDTSKKYADSCNNKIIEYTKVFNP